jgi:hypothetical protein
MRLIRDLRRIRFRYSLRIVLVLLTGLCVWLGLVSSRARQQRLATEQLKKLNATVVYDTRAEELAVPAWIRNLLGDDYFVTVVEVWLSDHQVGRKSRPLPSAHLDAAVAAMRWLPKLKAITFNSTWITDDNFLRLAPLANRIESLYFNEYWGELTGHGIRHLAGWPHLKSLKFHARRLEMKSLTHLAALPALERLRWSGYELDERAFRAIAAYQSLRSLTLFASSFSG